MINYMHTSVYLWFNKFYTIAKCTDLIRLTYKHYVLTVIDTYVIQNYNTETNPT